MVSNKRLFLYDISGEVSIDCLYSRSLGVEKLTRILFIFLGLDQQIIFRFISKFNLILP